MPAPSNRGRLTRGRRSSGDRAAQGAFPTAPSLCGEEDPCSAGTSSESLRRSLHPLRLQGLQVLRAEPGEEPGEDTCCSNHQSSVAPAPPPRPPTFPPHVCFSLPPPRPKGRCCLGLDRQQPLDISRVRTGRRGAVGGGFQPWTVVRCQRRKRGTSCFHFRR